VPILCRSVLAAACDAAASPGGARAALAQRRPEHDRDRGEQRDPREAHHAPSASLTGARPRLRHERVSLRGRLPRELVLALEHLRLVLNLAFLVHVGSFPFPYRADTTPKHAGRTVILMRALVIGTGLVSLLILILPIH
jgi:hypothetical protein